MRLFKFVLFVLVVSIFSITSCKKSDIAKSPIPVDSATIMGFKDSTQLVKSLSINDYDSLGNFVDSSTVYFYYDTVNKKIIISGQFTPSPSLANYLAVLSYNNNGLLTQETYNPVDSGGSINYTYDAQNIVSSQIITNFDGSTDATYLTKTSNSSGGYTLSYTTLPDPINYPSDSVLETISFDATGKVILAQEINLPDLSAQQIDSIIYDANGNVINEIEYGNSSGLGYSTYNQFEFTGRNTNGNQLSNLNSILYNGVTSFGFTFYGIYGSDFNGFDNWYLEQFTKYPAQSVTVYQAFTNSYETFSPNAQYDNLGRLTRLRMYNGDGSYYYEDYLLSYYK